MFMTSVTPSPTATLVAAQSGAAVPSGHAAGRPPSGTEFPAVTTAVAPTGQRVLAIDALRGFDMFWLIGGQHAVQAACDVIDRPWAKALHRQFTHPEWEGFTFYDLIFPLFLFLIGCSIPFAFSKRRQRGDSHATLYGHILLRVAIMVFLGTWVNGNLLTYDPQQFQLTYSVLQMLALGYLVAAVAWLNLSLRQLWSLWVSLLVVYWALQTFVPLPAETFRMGVYAEHANFGDWLNDQILGSWQGPWRFGWILEITTHGATCLLGVLAAERLRAGGPPSRTLRWLIIAGVLCLAVGLLWGLQFPIIKNRWTSTFVLFAGGWSLLLLALFYGVIDVLGFRRWCFPFVVIGANSIVAYMIAVKFKSAFGEVAWVFVEGLKPYAGAWHTTIYQAAALAVVWLFLYAMYRTKTFVRI
jgi:predicted acyltransferase